MLIAVQAESVSNMTKHWLQWCNGGDARPYSAIFKTILFIIIRTQLRVFMVHSHISMVKGGLLRVGEGEGMGANVNSRMYITDCR